MATVVVPDKTPALGFAPSAIVMVPSGYFVGGGAEGGVTVTWTVTAGLMNAPGVVSAGCTPNARDIEAGQARLGPALPDVGLETSPAAYAPPAMTSTSVRLDATATRAPGTRAIRKPGNINPNLLTTVVKHPGRQAPA
jgi:hypothetical protein